MRSKSLFLLSLLFFVVVALQAQKVYTVQTVPNIYKMKPEQYVSNPDDIITKADLNWMNSRIIDFEKNTSVEIAVVAIKSIGKKETRDFANKLFNHWKIGKKKKIMAY